VGLDLSRFFDARDPVRLVIDASPDDAVRRALEPLSPAVFVREAGFSRRPATPRPVVLDAE